MSRYKLWVHLLTFSWDELADATICKKCVCWLACIDEIAVSPPESLSEIFTFSPSKPSRQLDVEDAKDTFDTVKWATKKIKQTLQMKNFGDTAIGHFIKGLSQILPVETPTQSSDRQQLSGSFPGSGTIYPRTKHSAISAHAPQRDGVGSPRQRACHILICGFQISVCGYTR